MNQIIVNNVNALVAALQNLSDKDMELKRKDVLLDLGHNGHSRQYLQVSYMYDVGDKISDTLRGFYLQAEQVSVRIMRTRRGSLMPVKTRSGRGFTSLLTEAGRWSDNRFKSLPTERPDHFHDSMVELLTFLKNEALWNVQEVNQKRLQRNEGGSKTDWV